MFSFAVQFLIFQRKPRTLRSHRGNPSAVVGYDSIRAVGGHLSILWYGKALDLDGFVMRSLGLQASVYPLLEAITAEIIYLTVILEEI
ncbi:MAG: hypothetical protein ACXWTP_03675 [Methylosarcina sp.]